MRMKRMWLAALSILASLALATSVAQTAAAIQLIINGDPINLDVPPQVVNGRVLVPIRVISETLGFDVEWNSAAQAVTVTRRGESYPLPELSPGPLHLVIDGVEVYPDVPPAIVSGRLMVPIRIVSEAMGLVVAWDPVASIVRVDQGGAASSCLFWKFSTLLQTEVTRVFTVEDNANDLHFVFAQDTYVTEADFFADVQGNGTKEIKLSNPSDPVTGQPRSLAGQKVKIRFGTTAGSLKYVAWCWTKNGELVGDVHSADPPEGAEFAIPPK